MQQTNEIKVWDPLVRIFHWTLVIAFTAAYLTEEDLLSVHVYAGYVVLGLVAFRVLWGFIGTRHARFSDFVFGLRTVKDYLKSLLRLDARRYIGHNPAGGFMIILLLVGLLVTTVTGVAIYGVEEHAGPLAGWLMGTGEHWEEVLEETHEVFANITLALIFFHVAGVVFESLLHNENLVRSMFTGRKRA